MFNKGVTNMSSIYADSGYKFVVEFEKYFTKGTLNGLTVKDRVHFVTEEDAKRWTREVALLNRDGKYFNFKVKKAVA
jgi:hypothetical protein